MIDLNLLEKNIGKIKMFGSIMAGVFIILVILISFWGAIVEARKHPKYFTLRYLRYDGAVVTESYTTYQACKEQETYLEMVEKKSIIKERCN